MILEMKVPSPGESITEVEIATWLVEDGDYVEKDQPIAEVDSDKATLELPAEESGVVTLKAEEGDTVEVGAVVCLIDRNTLSKMFKMETVKLFINMALGHIANKVTVSQPVESVEGKEKIDWSIFKKFEILPLSKKSEGGKAQKIHTQEAESASLAVFQTLFREQLGGEGKVKTGASVESGYDKLYSMKTEVLSLRGRQKGGKSSRFQRLKNFEKRSNYSMTSLP